jgi:hypothetical protein
LNAALFLRGVGATLALPWLEIMTPTARAAQKLPPRRFVTFFQPNGVFPKAWNVNGTWARLCAVADFGAAGGI